MVTRSGGFVFWWCGRDLYLILEDTYGAVGMLVRLLCGEYR